MIFFWTVAHQRIVAVLLFAHVLIQQTGLMLEAAGRSRTVIFHVRVLLARISTTRLWFSGLFKRCIWYVGVSWNSLHLHHCRRI